LELKRRARDLKSRSLQGGDEFVLQDRDFTKVTLSEPIGDSTNNVSFKFPLEPRTRLLLVPMTERLKFLQELLEVRVRISMKRINATVKKGSPTLNLTFFGFRKIGEKLYPRFFMTPKTSPNLRGSYLQTNNSISLNKGDGASFL